MKRHALPLALLLLYALMIGWRIAHVEIESYEALEIHEADASLASFLDPRATESSYADRGPVYPALLRIHKAIVGYDIFRLRWLSAALLLGALAVLLYFPGATSRERIGASLFLIFNYGFIRFTTFVNPYSLVLLLAILYYALLEKRSRAAFWSSIGVGALGLLTFFTVAPAVWLGFLLGTRQARVSRRERILAAILLAVVTFPKLYMIVQMRAIRRRGDSVFDLLGWHDAAISLAELVGFRGNGEWWTYLGAALVSVMLVASVLRARRLRALTGCYLVFTLLSLVAMKAYGMHEIESRYYFALLPLLGLSLAGTKFLAPVLALSVFGFAQAAYRDRPKPFASTAWRLVTELRRGDLVCTPQANGLTLKLDQTVRHYHRIGEIDERPAEEYFRCRGLFFERAEIDAERLWIVTFGQELNLEEECDPRIDRFDCDFAYYRQLLQRYEPADSHALDVPGHAPAYLYRFDSRKLRKSATDG